MTHLFFKDKTLYEKINYSVIISTHFTKSERGKIIVEICNLTGDWIATLPLEEDLNDAEKRGEDISFWKKFRKDQKRKEYTQEQFDNIFMLTNTHT